MTTPFEVLVTEGLRLGPIIDPTATGGDVQELGLIRGAFENFFLGLFLSPFFCRFEAVCIVGNTGLLDEIEL
jgi:hypothetical protein